jgi:hypothetical protein
VQWAHKHLKTAEGYAEESVVITAARLQSVIPQNGNKEDGFE